MPTTSKPKARKHSRPTAPSPEAPRRFIAYYRVSTRAQGRSGLGIEAQQETVQHFLEAEGGGLPPLASYTETESGRRKDRPQLAKALAACRAHRATLVVAKVDRLARSQAFLESILTSGARVRFCDLPEIKGATGRFMLRQMASVAELEGEFIGERTKAALAARVARDGQWDRKAKHHLVPGAGQQAAVATLRSRRTHVRATSRTSSGSYGRTARGRSGRLPRGSTGRTCRRLAGDRGAPRMFATCWHGWKPGRLPQRAEVRGRCKVFDQCFSEAKEWAQGPFIMAIAGAIASATARL